MNYESAVPAMDGTSASDGSGTGAPAGRSRKGMIALLVFLGLLVAAVVAYLFVKQGGEGGDAGATNEQAPTVSVIAPGTATIAGTISATGTLAARRTLPVGIAGEGGRVISVPVDAGDWVRAGQVLAVIDRSVQTQQVSSARAQVEVARADARLAQANLDRALKLVERGFVSRADVDRLTATRDAAAARVDVAAASVRELQARNARLNVYAPSSGMVLQRSVEPGQIVSPGSGALFLMAQDGQMEMLAQLSEVDLAKVSIGQEAQVRPTGTDKQFTGQIWQIAPTINAQNRQGIARIALPYAPELRPGGFATATIKSGSMVAPMLPESAILSDDKGSYVYVIGKDNKALRRSVVLGTVTDDGIAIVKGLSGKEQIVLRAGGFLTEGETVVPRKQAE